jgi:hypothetical protein
MTDKLDSEANSEACISLAKLTEQGVRKSFFKIFFSVLENINIQDRGLGCCDKKDLH